ncbi:MAG: serine/threonine-protein kinase [Kofleriaceae bacterium]
MLDRLGSGGMGVVYAAYDPQLDRGVALKMVQVREGDREAALVEAKALAKLSHPNVVPVFDVGIEAGNVYIVMELVRGETLRDWVTERSQPEVLHAYRQAGAALAAAHAAGLVHRDFKPDNAIVGTDGRVRVVDFGLACEAGTQRAAGTPRYMAPEQAAGTAITPAADQFGFCVALAEALGPEPPPRWLAAVIERGRAAEPADRFASMDALLAALGRDPARVRRRWIAIAAAAVAVIAFVVVIRHGAADELEICGGGDAEIANAWPAPARSSALAQIAAQGAYGRELAPRLERELADHAAGWASGHRAACLDHRRGLQSDALFDRRMDCLQRGLAALAETAKVVTSATPANLPDVALAMAALPRPEQCTDRATLIATVDPPPPVLAPRIAKLRDELERARVLLAAGRIEPARELTRALVAEARELAYPPLLAEALLLDGHVAMPTDRGAATAILREATTVGFTARAEAIAIEAWARRAWLEGTGKQPAGALAGADVIEAIAARDQTTAFARALLHSNIGGVELAFGRREAAAAKLDQAIAESSTVHGADAIELLAARTSLVLASEDPVARDGVLADVVARLSALVGDHHPLTLDAGFVRATTTMISMPAAAELLATLGERQAIHPAMAAQTAECWAEVADLRFELGDPTAAIAAATRAEATGAELATNYPELAGYLRLWRGDGAGAVRSFEAALAKLGSSEGEAWYGSYARAKVELGLGRAHVRAGHAREALDVLATAAARLDAIARDHRAVAIMRRLARARAELGRARPDPELARAATEWFQRAGLRTRATPASP